MFLTAAARSRIPTGEFGMPGQRKYPMPDPSHAANAKGRAKQQMDRGNLSRAMYNQIVSKANRVEHG